MKNPLPYSRKQITILLACVGIFALGQFHRASGGIFTPILVERFALSAAGPRIVLTWCILLIAFGTILFALNHSYELSFLSRILIGVGLASMGAATHIIIARNFTAEDFGYVSGLVVTLGGIGGLLGTYPLAIALERLPWGLVFGIATAVSVLLAALVFGAIKADIPRVEQSDTIASQGGYLALLRQSEFLKILMLGLVTFAPIVTITGLWGGPFLQDVANFSAEGAGAVLSSSRKWLILTAVGLSSLSLFSLAALDGLGAYPMVFILLAMVFFQQFYIPLGAHMRKYVPDDMLGRASTLLSLVSVAAIPAMQIGFGAPRWGL